MLPPVKMSKKCFERWVQIFKSWRCCVRSADWPMHWHTQRPLPNFWRCQSYQSYQNMQNSMADQWFQVWQCWLCCVLHRFSSLASQGQSLQHRWKPWNICTAVYLQPVWHQRVTHARKSDSMCADGTHFFFQMEQTYWPAVSRFVCHFPGRNARHALSCNRLSGNDRRAILRLQFSQLTLGKEPACSGCGSESILPAFPRPPFNVSCFTGK